MDTRDDSISKKLVLSMKVYRELQMETLSN